MKKIHYRNVVRLLKFGNELSMTIPCGTNAHLTAETTKDESKVTCSRCLQFLQKLKKP